MWLQQVNQVEKYSLHVGTTGETPSGQVWEAIQITATRQMVIGAMGEDGAKNVICGVQPEYCEEEELREKKRQESLVVKVCVRH